MDAPEPLVIEAESAEAAIEVAAGQWEILPGDVRVRVLDEGKRFLGLFSRKARFELTPADALDLLKGKRVLSETLRMMDMEIEVEIREEGILNLTGPDAGIIIGKYGETLKSLEYLLNLISRESTESRALRLDSDGYRERRELSLQRVALSAAREASRRRRAVTLEPMTSWERRIVHLSLKENPEVETRSVGDEPQRRVVIWPRGGNRPQKYHKPN